MRLIKTLSSLIIITILTNFACSKNDSPYKSIRIGKESIGATISLNVGDTLIASLRSNPTTGYSWHLMKLDTSKVDLDGFSYIQDKPALTGTGGTESFRFITIGAGTTELGMTYARSGLTDTIPIDSFRVNLQIVHLMPD